jgi:nucleotide-binding universal stress UspA family protein
VKTLNPFLYGRPVPPSRFIGRGDAVRTVFSRIYNRESTAIVGEPHIGKSSILSYIADQAIRTDWLRERAGCCVFTTIDCHMIPRQFSPAQFWSHSLADLPQAVAHAQVARQWQATHASDFGSFQVKRLFEAVSAVGWCVVLVIDEFDVLVNHPNFSAEFFGALRSLAIGTNALAVITASRLPVAEMNRRTLELSQHGSPFFNNFAEVRLLPLSPDECRTLIGGALALTEVVFSDADYELIFALSGRHPYLVQIAASALFDVELAGKAIVDRSEAAGTLFHDRAAAHFDDVWRHLPAMEQAVLLVLALQELKGRLDSEAADAGELRNLNWCEASLRHLHDAGMVESMKDHGSAAGRSPASLDARWRVASRGFVWWVIDNVITQTRDTIQLESRLQEYEHRGILSERRSQEVRNLAASIEVGAVKGPTEVGRLLLSDSGNVATLNTSPTQKAFDVFFSYSHADRKAVLQIADQLRERGVRAWIDVRELRPGFPWQEALETQIKTVGAAAVFVGSKGIGPWQDAEQAALLRQFAKRKCPVIPVILPKCRKVPELPVFLEGMHWIDCRDTTIDPIEQLLYGITGTDALQT